MIVSHLPIDEVLLQILAELEANSNVVVVAPPGAGKTTRVPPAVARLSQFAGKAIVLLQPRRVAARAAAARIAAEQAWKLGEEVGYHIRFENRTSHKTRVRVLTEGILARQIQSDPFLEDIRCVILDEFHERSIHTDLAIAMLREIQTTVRPDLRLVVMSATMDPRPVADYLGARICISEGRCYPIEHEYLPQTDARPVWEKMAPIIQREASRADSGHILAFLPGIHEIRRTASAIDLPGAEIHVLHSSVSNEEQDRALRPSDSKKVILATNIAETSLTIDGVRTVIDSGLVRVLVNDARLGIDRLELRRVSIASANQRAGRAGRTAPGKCIRLWSRGEETGFSEQEAPEIQRVDLAATLLLLKSYGVRDACKFEWYEAPPEEAIARAEKLLWMIGACTATGEVTEIGRQIGKLPLHPRLGRLLVAGAVEGLLEEAATMAALLGERDLLSSQASTRRREAAVHGCSDLVERLELFHDGARRTTIEVQTLRQVQRVRDELLDLVRRSVTAPAARTDINREDGMLRLPLYAYADRVTVRRMHDSSRGVMVGNRGIMLEPSSTVRSEPLFLSIDPRESSDSREARVSIASAIEEEWLRDIHPHLCEQRDLHKFDDEKQRVVTVRQFHFAGLVVREIITGAREDLAGASRILYEHLANQAAFFFAGDDAANRWLARLRFLAPKMPELNLPAMDDAFLRDVLGELCDGCTSVEQVRRKPAVQALQSRLDYRQQRAVEEFAPETMEVPSGNRIRLQYDESGIAPPVLAVRLQELFGLAETPRVANGRVPVLLYLLGPNYRPVQITQDLASFWNKTYGEVRKDLRARYPKHPWPDDPWSAPPKSVGGRRRN